MGSFAQHVFDRDQAAEDAQRQVQLAPLQEALKADQTRLALYANPDDPSKPLPGKEAEYNATHERMANTIGQIRGLYGDKQKGANPVEAGVGNLLDKLHITNHLKNHVAAVRAANAAKYAGQTGQMANEYAIGAYQPNALLEKYNQALQIPGITPEQALLATIPGLSPKTPEEQFIVDYRTRHPQSTMEDAVKAYTADTNKTPPKPLKGWKILDQDGIPYGVMNQDTGQQVLAGPNGELPNDAPPDAGKIWGTVQAAIKAKEAERQKADEARDKRLANTLNNLGTWTIAEDGNGGTVLYNSKTGQTKQAAPGLHKSGYFAKQIAPFQAAALNIKDYMDNGIFDGPGDLALQHEFFTATQPATGFRMTKVQQDILQDSRSWLDSWKAKALHATTGQWFTEKQRKQLADAAQQAIAAKIKVMEGAGSAPEGNKSREIKRKADSARSGEKSSGFNWSQYPTQ